jgi:hypothetical protein
MISTVAKCYEDDQIKKDDKIRAQIITKMYANFLT